MVAISFEQWLRAGMRRGYCGPIVCATHDGIPTTAAEDDEGDEGGDPCIPVIRPYADKLIKAAVEANHSPTQWRDTNSNPAAGRSGTFPE